MSRIQALLTDLFLYKIDNRIVEIVRDIFLVAGFAFLTGLSAKLKIEMCLVPITMQTFVVLLSGVFLGARKAAFSQIAYLGMGLMGIPWFARGGGMVYIFSPTFGYIVGFVLAAFFVGWFYEREIAERIRIAVLIMFFGNILIYFPGLLWLSRFVGIKQALMLGFYPFIIGDVFKILLAAFFSVAVSRYVTKGAVKK